MKISIRGYITHKEAEKYSDCADRYAVNTGNNRFAIADGVSKSFFPDIWAEMLVENFVKVEKGRELSVEIMEKCQSDWFKEVERKATASDAKWYTKNAFIKQEPGLATFVGLRFEDGRWFANALGDSFLFFVPKESKGFDDWIKLSSKPEPVVFDSFPDYFSSRKNQHGETKTMERVLSAGTFYLMTDALSEWIFNQKEKAIEEIRKWHNQEEFERSIDVLRSLNMLNNDDSAILIIEVEKDNNSDLTYEKKEIQSLLDLIENEKSTEEKIVEDKKESFVEEAKTKIANHETENKVLLNDEGIQETVDVETETEIELSEYAQEIYDKCIGIYNNALSAIAEQINLSGNYNKKKISEDEQKQIIKKLEEYGISLSD